MCGIATPYRPLLRPAPSSRRRACPPPYQIFATNTSSSAGSAPPSLSALNTIRHGLVLVLHPKRHWLALILLPCHLFAECLVMLHRGAFAEIFHLEELANLNLAVYFVRVRATLHPFDRLGNRFHLDNPVAGDQLLRFGKRPVDHSPLVAGKSDARGLRARLQPRGIEQDASLDHVLVEFRHRAEQFLRRHFTGFGILTRLHDHHETHRIIPLACVADLSQSVRAGCCLQSGKSSPRPGTGCAGRPRSLRGCLDPRSAAPSHTLAPTGRHRPERTACRARPARSPEAQKSAA